MSQNSPNPADKTTTTQNRHAITNLDELAKRADYSLMDSLVSDPQATEDGRDHQARQVFSGHYVPVSPTPIPAPQYVAHGRGLFRELGLADELARSPDFMRVFSGDLSQVPAPMRRVGWATGYALSIYGTEYTQQCPFQTGNGYGDGRAISVLEAVVGGKRWEMQLKGGGRTPYCRGADGRAVLRSSVREFLAQEHMHALGVPTSRSLSLYVSQSEQVKRPWYSEGSKSSDPDMLVAEAVAITTRVAPSFIRVGQLELFGRRARGQAHPQARDELEQLVLHLIEREYAQDIGTHLDMADKVVLLAKTFRARLTALVANWLRVGYCQGNFNSDNCAAGGFTLDYGPFGFCEAFDPYFQPWTGGGQHFAFWNQPAAAERNFEMFCRALSPLLEAQPEALKELDEVKAGFAAVMQNELEKMWSAKLGLERFDASLFQTLALLMMQTPVDYTLFFRELSSLPEQTSAIRRSFYGPVSDDIRQRWQDWLQQWQAGLREQTAPKASTLDDIAEQMKRTNPKYTLREWHLAPAYRQASQGDYRLIEQLQQVITQPYAEQSDEIEAKYYSLRPAEFSQLGGVAHMSCSS